MSGALGRWRLALADHRSIVLARLARLATHAVLDPADRALVHPTGPGKVTTPLPSRQGSPDFTNLFVRQLGERVLFPSYTSPVPQAVGCVLL